MCGILGVIPSVEEGFFTSCLDRLIHRGPDDSGVWSDRDRAMLGHRRLSILDLSPDGRQPMLSPDKRHAVVFNGEIYNFLELRGELEKLGHCFVSQSDTEVLLAAFRQWGESFLHRLNGMWAMAIWDSREQTLFLARDRFGKKPLFYARIGDKFVFASEMKAIFPFLDQVRPSDSFFRLKDEIFTYENGPDCLIEGIRRFPAGSFGWLKDGELKITRYWNTLDHLVEPPRRYEDQVERLRELFLDAVRIRMRSDVAIGTALSGGLDSSATISCMAHLGSEGPGGRMAGDWQHAFVACFPGSPLDESRYARMVTDNIAIKADFLEIDPLKGVSRMDDFFYLFEDLYITSPIPFMLTYGAMRENGVVVTIDGHGADECFCGYDFDLIHALDDAGWNPARAVEVLKTRRDMRPKDKAQFKSRPLLLDFLERRARVLAKRILGRKDPFRSKDADHPNFARLDHLNRRLYASTHDTILPTLLRNYDRYSMANGVEIRMPFLDYRVVGLAFSLPWTSKVRNGFSKAVVRDAMARFMPPEVAYRKGKIGFNSPVVDWMKGPLKEFFLDIINSTTFRQCALIDADKVAKKILHVIESPQAGFSDGEQAWTLLSPYIWEQAVIKGWRSRGPASSVRV